MSRLNKRLHQEDASRYQLRAGIAKVALQSKADGRSTLDSSGRPFRYSNEMASRHSMSTLERWTKDRSTKAFLVPDSSYAQGWQRIFGGPR